MSIEREARGNVRHNMRASILNGGYTMISTGIIGTFVPLYLIDALHASNQEIALLSSLPALVSMAASVAGLLMIPHLLRYKMFTIMSIAITRVSYILLAFIPWLSVAWSPTLTVDLVALGNFPQSLGTLGWQALIAQLIPERLRSGFFSQRNVIITLVGLVATAVTGGLLQWFNPHWLWPYQVLFMLAGGFGAAEVYYLTKHREPFTVPATPLKVAPLAWRTLLRHKRFVRYTLVAAFFNFGWQLSWPLFTIFQIRDARATGLWLGLFTVAAQLGQIATFRWWGRQSARSGLKTLALASAGVATVPWLTVLSTNLWYLTAVNFESGIFLSGVSLLLFTQLLAQIPHQDRPHYIAAYNVVLGAIAFLAPEFGVWCLSWLNLKDTMALSSVWRLAGAVLFLAIALGPGAIIDRRGLWGRVTQR